MAIVSTLRHERPHDHIAYEIFFPTGPFALLPMTDDAKGHRSAIVWSVPKDDAAGWMSLSDEEFAAEAQAAMGGFLGKIALAAPRSTYPLGFHHAAQITDERLALVGDAAHAIHPIAGQGLNLGFRDAAALAQVLVEGARLGPRSRRPAIARPLPALALARRAVGGVRDRQPDPIYGIPGKTASAVRRFGMGLIDRLEPDQEPADERSARHERRASAAAARTADLTYCSVGSISAPLDGRRAGTASAGPAGRRGRRGSPPRAAPAWRRRRTARPGRWR